MNQLQAFMAECNRQTRIGSGTPDKPQPIDKEIGVYNNEKLFGTFIADAVSSEMARQGYIENAFMTFIVERSLCASMPPKRLLLTRPATGEVYFVEDINTEDPVIYVFKMVNRAPGAKVT